MGASSSMAVPVASVAQGGVLDDFNAGYSTYVLNAD